MSNSGDITVDLFDVNIFGFDNSIDVTYANVPAGSTYSISGHADFSINATTGEIRYTGDSTGPSSPTLTVTITSTGYTTKTGSSAVNIVNDF